MTHVLCSLTFKFNMTKETSRIHVLSTHPFIWFRLFSQSKILFLSRVIASCKFRAAIRSLINVTCHYGVSSASNGFDVLVDNVRRIKIVEIYTRKSSTTLFCINNSAYSITIIRIIFIIIWYFIYIYIYIYITLLPLLTERSVFL